MSQSFRGYSWQGSDNKAKAPAAEVSEEPIVQHALLASFMGAKSLAVPTMNSSVDSCLSSPGSRATGSMRAPVQCVQMPMMILTATPSVTAIGGGRTTPKARPLVLPLGHVAGCSRSHRTNALDYCLLINHLQILSLRGPHLCTS
jgi:hypothetical protein